MKITYFTIEDISSGLFSTQVLNLLSFISDLDEEIQFELIVLNAPHRNKKNKESLKRFNKILEGTNITIRFYSVLPPLRHALKSKLQSQLILMWLTIIFKYIVRPKGEIIHCRSYWATLVALKSGQKNVIFDMRSLLPYENVSAGNLKMNSRAYKQWISHEKYCLKNSIINCAVSQGMKDYIDKICSPDKNKLIPIMVKTNELKFDENSRKKFRNDLNWDQNIIFVYSGSLGLSGINISAIMNLILRIKSISDEFRFLFLTSENKEKLFSLLTSNGLSESKFKIFEAKGSELGKYLSASDIGYHALPMQLDSNTRLGTKVVEYWINGLPVIVNNFVGAAAELIITKDLGFVIDETNNEDFNMNVISTLRQKTRDEISKKAVPYFGIESISSLYLESYHKIYNNEIKH